MSEYHEPVEYLSEYTKNYHRALKSLQEELEAIDWYQQRVDATDDSSLKDVLAHNRDEEIEHACMALEWLRRNSPEWDKQLKTYLFTEIPITAIEEKEESEKTEGHAFGGGIRRGLGIGLNIGSLRGEAGPQRIEGGD